MLHIKNLRSKPSSFGKKISYVTSSEIQGGANIDLGAMNFNTIYPLWHLTMIYFYCFLFVARASVSFVISFDKIEKELYSSNDHSCKVLHLGIA